MGWYYVITEEMRALGLKGNELVVFAIINGYSQNGEGCYFGSLSHLCEVAGISRPTAVEILKTLVDKGLLDKVESIANGVKSCRYSVVKNLYHQLRNLTGGSKETLPGGGKETLPNNKIQDNKIDIKEKEKDTYVSKKKYGETVYLTDAEHAKLVASQGDEIAAACIEQLDLYKQASGRKYKSDYAAILNWVVGRVTEDRQRVRTSRPEPEGVLEHNHRLGEEAKAYFRRQYSNPDNFPTR